MLSLILACLCLAGALPDTPPDTWKQFASSEGKFAATMPDEPKTSLIVTDTIEGRLVTRTVSATDKDLNEYLVSWTEYPNEKSIEQRASARLFARVRDALAATKEARVLQEATITSEGHPAQAFSMKTVAGRIVNVRFYFVANRFYQVMAETKPGHSDAGERFLNSFKLLANGLI